ncbi:MAG: SGNH/GDSL hydrolase family protein [Polyangiales bacterium]
MTRARRLAGRSLFTHGMLVTASVLAFAVSAADVAEAEANAEDDVMHQALLEAAQAAPGFTRYIAFGDSFVSGVGALDVDWNNCGTSPWAWPHGVRAGLQIPESNFTFKACSGAKTPDVLSMAELGLPGQISFLPPPEQSDPSTLITIAIGGNDVKLDERVRNCFLGSSSSSGPSVPSAPSAPPAAACADLQTLLNNIDAVINDTVATNLATTFGALRNAAPYSTIVAIGYPHLIAAEPACNGTWTGAALDSVSRQKLNYLVDAMNYQIKVAASNAGIYYIVDEVVSAFAGHEACAADPWIVSADEALRTRNWGVGHPNENGYKAYADALLRVFLQ